MIRSRAKQLFILIALVAMVAPIGCDAGASCSADTRSPASLTAASR